MLRQVAIYPNHGFQCTQGQGCAAVPAQAFSLKSATRSAQLIILHVATEGVANRSYHRQAPMSIVIPINQEKWGREAV